MRVCCCWICTFRKRLDESVVKIYDPFANVQSCSCKIGRLLRVTIKVRLVELGCQAVM